MRTDVQLTCCRTFPEFMSDCRNDSERFGGRVMAAPAEVISEIRAQIQDETNAEAFYRRLLMGYSVRPRGTPVAFRRDLAMGYAAGQDVTPIENVGESVGAVERQQEAVGDARAAANNPPDEGAAPDATAAPAVRTPAQSILESAGAAEGQRTVRHNIEAIRTSE